MRMKMTEPGKGTKRAASLVSPLTAACVLTAVIGGATYAPSSHAAAGGRPTSC